MSLLFVCENCNCVDTTNNECYDGTFVCAECKTGEWHHFFSKETYDETQHRNVLNRPSLDEENNTAVFTIT